MIETIGHIRFLHPEVLWGLLIVPLIITWYIWRLRKRAPRLQLSSISTLQKGSTNWRGHARNALVALRWLAIIAAIVALARPVLPNFQSDIETEGIDIVITLDVSTSMLAQDFKPNRLEAAKDVAVSFIEERETDRIGLVVFSGEAMTQCPLTLDHALVQSLMKELETGLLKDGTAIGMGLGTAVNRLKESEVTSKVIILLTDGVNNRGAIDPMTAAQLAAQYNIRVYTIGVGSKGTAYSPVGVYPDGSLAYDYVPVEIDEALLRQIADTTGGQYFRATDKAGLAAVYQEIDQMEKSRVKVSTVPKPIELYWYPVALALGLVVIAFVARNTFLRTIT